MSEVFTTNSGIKITVNPMTPRNAAGAMKILKKKGFNNISSTRNWEEDLEFQLALATVVTVDVTRADGTSLNQNQKVEWLENTPGAIAFVCVKASELAKQMESEFETDRGNS